MTGLLLAIVIFTAAYGSSFLIERVFQCTLSRLWRIVWTFLVGTVSLYATFVAIFAR